MKCKLLVAEDELIERKVLCKTLQKYLGDLIVLYEARNGREALELYVQEAPQVVILDIEMPGYTGLEVARKIRETDKNCGILFLTGYDKFAYAKQAIAVRALDYLLKPYKEQELVFAVEDAIRQVSARSTPLPPRAQPTAPAAPLHTEEEDEENGCYLSISDVVGTDLDPKLYVAFQILEYALIDAPGAPLKQALLDAKIGGDIMGGYDSGILQPYFSVIAKYARADQKGEFLAVVKGTLRKLANEGLNRKSLLAAMNYYEFKYREADYGNYPKGLMYGLQCMDSWLYDGDPMMHLAYGDTFAFLKEAVKDGYFEQLIKDYLLDNPFEAIIVVKPEKNLTAKEDARVAEKLAAYKFNRRRETGPDPSDERVKRIPGYPIQSGRTGADPDVRAEGY